MGLPNAGERLHRRIALSGKGGKRGKFGAEGVERLSRGLESMRFSEGGEAKTGIVTGAVGAAVTGRAQRLGVAQNRLEEPPSRCPR